MSTTTNYRRYAPSRDEAYTTNSKKSIISSAKPETTGTSWTSLRFTNPNLPEDYRGHSSRLAKTFEIPSTSTASNYAPSVSSIGSSRYSLASTNAPSTASTSRSTTGTVRLAMANYQKAVAGNDRPNRLRSNVAGPLMTYRSQVARDMFSPSRYIPKENRQIKEIEPIKPSNLASSYLNQTAKSTGIGSVNEQRNIFSPPRDTFTHRTTTRPFSTSSASTMIPNSSNLVANSTRRPISNYETELSVTKALNKPIAKADRPWRQRMAETARLRDLHGNDLSTDVMNRLSQSRVNRRNSNTSNNGDELSQSLALLKSIVADPNEKSSSIRFRNREIPTATTTEKRISAPIFVLEPVKSVKPSEFGKTLAEAQKTENLNEKLSARPNSMGISQESTMSRRNDRPNRLRSNVAGPLMTYRSQVARDMFSPSRYIPKENRQIKEIEPIRPSNLASSYLNQTAKSTGIGSVNEQRNIFSPPRDTFTHRTTTRPFSSSSPSTMIPNSSNLVANSTRRPTSNYETELSVTKALNKPIAKADRPWRQRMAETARLRDLHGNDLSTDVMNRLSQSRVNRRNSNTSNNGDELSQSLALLKSIVADPNEKSSSIRFRNREIPTTTTTEKRISAPIFVLEPVKSVKPSEFGKTLAEAQKTENLNEKLSARPNSMGISQESTMSRSYSPIRSTGSLFSKNTNNYGSLDNVRNLPPIFDHGKMYKDNKQTIIEENQEKFDVKKRNPRSSKERTQRRDSRQRSQSKDPPLPASSSSSDEDSRPQSRRHSRDPPKRRKLKKRTPSLTKELKDDSIPNIVEQKVEATIPVQIWVPSTTTEKVQKMVGLQSFF
uniref:Uncharacterized protein n=1 Tax=Panagrolaimus sp. JU765 TaxID=591449 RepID=A0AC34PXZ1_9BILA